MCKRILFVDDESNLIKSMKRLLHTIQNNYKYDFAIGGPEALTFMESNNIDVLVTDLQMPEITGIDLAEYAKKQNNKIKVILLSGETDDGLYRNNLIDSSLSKPCDINDLLKTIDEVID